ncbi:hypothetical protein [Leptolyngbya sp. PCC 6406]|uniref:hypothetical protein n=1 Tax=Leptolyngbya sp. PCC 6406 TaxID=1173264 RepID=UPI0002AC2467|nr:hypothetical protein [Leptolyngbya sp. PCC 6406]
MSYAHGWLLPQWLTLDATYQGRYELWRLALTQSTVSLLPPEPVPFLNPKDAGFERTLKMIEACIKALGGYGRGGITEVSFLARWLLYGLGHPYQGTPPVQPYSGSDITPKLAQTLDLELLMRCPSDYFGHILAQGKYGQKHSRFYPTLPSVAEAMAAMGHQVGGRSGQRMRAFDPCLGTGRLSLAASNYCRAMVGWERDKRLLESAIANFMLYAPDLALPIPKLGGDLIWGDALEQRGTSLISGAPLDSRWAKVPEVPTLVKATVNSPQEGETRDQLTLF